MSSKLKDVIFD